MILSKEEKELLDLLDNLKKCIDFVIPRIKHFRFEKNIDGEMRLCRRDIENMRKKCIQEIACCYIEKELLAQQETQ